MLLLLVGVAVVASGCTLNGHPAPRRAAPVLGQPKATPQAVGQPAPDGSGEFGAVSCATVRRCWAVGVAGPNPAPAPDAVTVIIATTDGGRSWAGQRVTGGSTPELSGVSCPTGTQCMAVGSNGSSLPGGGVVVTTGDAGATWSLASSPANALVVTSVDCAGPADCTAIVNSGTSTWSAHSADFGASWQQEGDLPPSFLPGNALTCVAGGTCLVPGYVPTSNGHGQGAIAVSADGGQTWALATVPAGAGILQTTACLSASVCIAAGTTSTTVSDVVPAKGELLHSADGGHTWTPSTAALPVDDIYGIACPTAQLCAMVGTDWVGFPAVGTGAVAQSADAGTTFRATTTAYVPTTLAGVACPASTTHCVAVGGGTVARLTLIAPKPPPTADGSSGTEPASA